MIEWTGKEFPADANLQRESTPPDVLQEYQQLMNESRESQELHNAYAEEMRILLYIKNGDPEGLAAALRELSQKGGIAVGVMSKNEFRQSYCMLLVDITLFTRFAIEGGLEQEQAFNLSDAYLRIADRTTDSKRLQWLDLVAGFDFARRVRAHRLSGVPAVRAGRDYISLHLHEKLTLQEVAAACDVTPNYLSSLFRAQLGVSAKEYILQEKLEAARRMLLTTDATIAEIAAHFNFSSHSNFSEHFRRRYGVSPNTYRNEIHSAIWEAIG